MLASQPWLSLLHEIEARMGYWDAFCPDDGRPAYALAVQQRRARGQVSEEEAYQARKLVRAASSMAWRAQQQGRPAADTLWHSETPPAIVATVLSWLAGLDPAMDPWEQPVLVPVIHRLLALPPLNPIGCVNIDSRI